MFYRVTLSWDGMSAVMWTLVALSVPLTVGRYIIRWRTRHRFFADDAAHLVALVNLFIFAGFAQAMFPEANELFTQPTSKSSPPPVKAELTFRRLQLGISITFYISLWAVKISFMLFYRLLFWISPPFRKVWWPCMAFIGITFWIPIAGQLTSCGPASDYYNLEDCAKTFTYQFDVFVYICVFHCLTDAIVIVLPIWMLSGIQVQRGQKIALCFLFSVAIVTIVLDCVRTAESVHDGIINDSILYSILEVTFGVYLSCLPTYRALFGIERKTKAAVYHPWVFHESKVRQNSSPGTKTRATSTLDEVSGGFELLEGNERDRSRGSEETPTS